MEWSEIWTTMREAITSLATVIGLVLALKGYGTWRRQIVGKTGHDVARAVPSAALKVREAIRHVRRPGAIFFPGPEDGEGADPYTTRLRMQRRVAEHYSERLDRMQATLVEFELAALEAEAVWSDEGAPQIKGLVDCVHELRGAVWEYVTSKAPDTGADSSLRNPDRENECWRIVHEPPQLKSGKGQPDAFGVRLDGAISEIQRVFRPKLQLEQR